MLGELRTVIPVLSMGRAQDPESDHLLDLHDPGKSFQDSPRLLELRDATAGSTGRSFDGSPTKPRSLRMHCTSILARCSFQLRSQGERKLASITCDRTRLRNGRWEQLRSQIGTQDA